MVGSKILCVFGGATDRGETMGQWSKEADSGGGCGPDFIFKA